MEFFVDFKVFDFVWEEWIVKLIVELDGIFWVLLKDLL